jgi:tetratricopeptide (TPR) repeat protein
LAPADSVCAACGEPVAAETRVALLKQRAEGLAGEELFAQAARVLETLLALPLSQADAKLLRRKRGAWLQRSGDPALMDAAEAALLASLRLDDGDDLSHQLWIDLLHRRGRLDEARKEYKSRLEADPDDAVAKRHLVSLRLMDDLKLAPPPKLDLPAVKGGLLMRAVHPTTSKMIAAGTGVLSCLYMLFEGWFGTPAALPDGAESLGTIMKLAQDPWLNVAQVVIYSAYIFWGWKVRHDA